MLLNQSFPLVPVFGAVSDIVTDANSADVPLVPDVPAVPLLPAVPLTPLVPDEPAVPPPPLVPAVTKDDVAIKVVVLLGPPTHI